MISLAFYWSSMISQLIEVKRDHFWQRFLHHIISITLLSFLWIYNTYRIGTVVLLINDVTDAALSVSKFLEKLVNLNYVDRCQY